MLPQIFRTFLQNGVHFGSKINSNFTGQLVQKLKTVTPQYSLCSLTIQSRNFISKPMSSLSIPKQISNEKCAVTTPLLQTDINSNVLRDVPIRTMVKYSRSTGQRLPNLDVLDRFYRLNWGIWIRTKAGRHRSLWKKKQANIRRSRQHVFCNSTQSYLLDKMVTKPWRKPKFFVDDPYNPYHQREEFWITRTKPLP